MKNVLLTGAKSETIAIFDVKHFPIELMDSKHRWEECKENVTGSYPKQLTSQCIVFIQYLMLGYTGRVTLKTTLER